MRENYWVKLLEKDLIASNLFIKNYQEEKKRKKIIKRKIFLNKYFFTKFKIEEPITKKIKCIRVSKQIIESESK